MVKFVFAYLNMNFLWLRIILHFENLFLYIWKLNKFILPLEFLFTKDNQLNDCFSSQSKNRSKIFLYFHKFHIIIIFYNLRRFILSLPGALPSGNTFLRGRRSSWALHEDCFGGISYHLSSNAAILCSALYSAAPGSTRTISSIRRFITQPALMCLLRPSTKAAYLPVSVALY